MVDINTTKTTDELAQMTLSEILTHLNDIETYYTNSTKTSDLQAWYLNEKSKAKRIYYDNHYTG